MLGQAESPCGASLGVAPYASLGRFSSSESQVGAAPGVGVTSWGVWLITAHLSCFLLFLEEKGKPQAC